MRSWILVVGLIGLALGASQLAYGWCQQKMDCGGDAGCCTFTGCKDLGSTGFYKVNLSHDECKSPTEGCQPEGCEEGGTVNCCKSRSCSDDACESCGDWSYATTTTCSGDC